jgi:DNA repair protein SbcC/Rad50
MIPITLAIQGFLSYRDPVELDFSGLSLACISGHNGAGKSSLLDAITWSLFGQARKRDDSLINAQSNVAEVVLIFSYEGNVYRVQRTKARDKVTRLEFNILQNNKEWTGSQGSIRPVWKSLTEGTLRDTEARLTSILRLDYETFVNASFFLQGKADQFTQQRPGDRKRILSSILGLEIWEAYRQRTTDRRKVIEGELTALDGRLEEINLELSEESSRIERLAQLESDLETLAEARRSQDTALQNIKKISATLEEQRKLVSSQARQVEAACRRLELEVQKEQVRLQERDECLALLSRSEEVEAAYQSWQKAREDLENWEEVAAQFREHEKRRLEPLTKINEERVRIESEIRKLEEEKGKVEAIQKEQPGLRERLHGLEQARQEIQEKLEERSVLEAQLNQARQNQADARAENPRLKEQMEELRERIDRLSVVEDAQCPLCGQPMSEEERLRLVQELQAQGKLMGDRYRANLAFLKEAETLVLELENSIQTLSRKEKDLAGIQREIDRIDFELKTGDQQLDGWRETRLPKLMDYETLLLNETYAPAARISLAEIDAGLKAIGYDAAAHDWVRREETEGRASEAELRRLERSRATFDALEREINEIQKQVHVFRNEFQQIHDEHERSAAALLEAEAKAPDVYEAERALNAIQEKENQLQMEVGAARQKVLVLDDLKNRKKNITAQREILANRVGQLRHLERAFGKDGVPALLIEQALPQIESRANDLLERLSAGSMSVRFVTQAEYKDKRRNDLRETLEIQISDSSGTRDYEMFSGGEAFRVNFAIRLALSEVLAQRAGARLQTLVIDEGFGSQDAQGRQRLVESINQVRDDFAMVLVITHIDELRDAFPARIEVEKTSRGSQVKIV